MIVIAGDYGQLGNRLIVFANMIAAAREYGLTVANPAFHEYAPHFDATRRDALCRYPSCRSMLPAGPAARAALHHLTNQTIRYARKFRSRTRRWPPGMRVHNIGWYETCDLDRPGYVDAARRPGLLFAKGWLFRARRSFTRHTPAVRAFFTPTAEHSAAAAACVDGTRRDGDLLIGVHVRQGDYREFLGGRFFYPTTHYVGQMRQLAASLPHRRVAFLVCSNEPQSPEVFEDLCVHFGPGHPVQDLTTLAGCDYILGPPSTFSAWASFYGEVPLGVLRPHNANLSLDDVARSDEFAWNDELTLADFAVVRDFNRPIPDLSVAATTAVCV